MNAEYVIKITSEMFGVTPEQLTSASRETFVMDARRVAVKLMVEELGMSLGRASEAVGRARHSTAINSIRRANSLMATEPMYNFKVCMLQFTLKMLARDRDLLAKGL